MRNLNFPAVRQAVYVLVVGIVGAGVALGVLSPGQETAIMEAVGGVLAAAALILAAANVNAGKPPATTGGDLPVYDGDSTADYAGRHRAGD